MWTKTGVFADPNFLGSSTVAYDDITELAIGPFELDTAGLLPSEFIWNPFAFLFLQQSKKDNNNGEPPLGPTDRFLLEGSGQSDINWLYEWQHAHGLTLGMTNATTVGRRRMN